jgi:hypothetical protein
MRSVADDASGCCGGGRFTRLRVVLCEVDRRCLRCAFAPRCSWCCHGLACLCLCAGLRGGAERNGFKLARNWRTAPHGQHSTAQARTGEQEGMPVSYVPLPVAPSCPFSSRSAALAFLRLVPACGPLG